MDGGGVAVIGGGRDPELGQQLGLWAVVSLLLTHIRAKSCALPGLSASP